MYETIKTKQLSLLTLALGVLFVSGIAAAQQYMLYTEKTYAQAGVVTPSVQQAHFFEAGEVVTITAQPYQGYEFIYWLGDVEEKTSRTTKVVMDGPRYVVAVFEPSMVGEGVEMGMQSLEEGSGGSNAGVGGSKALASNSITQRSFKGIGSFMANSDRPGTLNQPSATAIPRPVYKPQTGLSPNPIIPEPATLALLGVGALGIGARRALRKRRQSQTTEKS